MNEKMTDEQIEADIEGALIGYVRCAQRLKAHIAALTVEWDEARRSREFTVQWYAERMERLKQMAKERGCWSEMAAILANGTATTHEPPSYAQQLNMAKHRAESAETERDALRERVKALEADLDHSRKTSGKAIVEARDRVAAADRAVEVWRTECRAAESRLAAIRQRAREHATVGSIALNAMSLPDAEPADAGRAADSYILGEDAPAPVSEEESLRSTIRAAHTEIAALQAQLSGASEAIHSVRDAMLEEVDTLLSEVFRECERGTTTGTDFRKGVFYMLKTARERLAVLKSAPTPMDVRPVAPPEAFTHEKGLDAGVFDDAPLNPDATSEADQPLPEGPLEPADMTNEESGRICADAGVDVETGVAKCLEMVAAKRAEKPAPFRSEDEDPPLLLPQTPARHYPTTSEAFATAQGALHSFLGLIRIHYANRTECDGGMERGCLSGLGALSLLERRIGAARALVSDVERLDDLHSGGGIVAVSKALLAALTDAPSVFTLEEARKAVAGQGLSDEVDAEIVARLAAMRRRP